MNKQDHTSKSPKAMECTCPSDFQDRRYGKNMRLHNPKANKEGSNWRCTVCGRERE